MKRGRSEILVSPVVKKRRVRSHQDEGEGEGSQGGMAETYPHDLFDGYSFLLTKRTKEDKHLG